MMSAEVNRRGSGVLCTLLTNSKFTPPVSEIGDPAATPAPFTRDLETFDSTGLVIPAIAKNNGYIGIWLRRKIPIGQPANIDVLSELRAGILEGTTGPPPPDPDPPSPPIPPGGGGGGGPQIYPVKSGGYVYANGDESGGMCQGDGIRLNLTNFRNTIVNHETTWRNIKFTSNPRSCTDKPWWSPKSGTHDHSDNSCILIECSFTYDGAVKGARTERGNKNYQGCNGLQKFSNPPNINTGSVISVKYCTWVLADHSHEYHQWWIAEGQDSTNYRLMAMLVDGNPNQCQQPPIGITGTYTGPQVELADTWRGNGATITYGKYDLVEIDIPSAPRTTNGALLTTEDIDAAETIFADTELMTYDCDDVW